MTNFLRIHNLCSARVTWVLKKTLKTWRMVQKQSGRLKKLEYPHVDFAYCTSPWLNLAINYWRQHHLLTCVHLCYFVIILLCFVFEHWKDLHSFLCLLGTWRVSLLATFSCCAQPSYIYSMKAFVLGATAIQRSLLFKEIWCKQMENQPRTGAEPPCYC